MANKLDLANAQFIGFYYGKWQSTDNVGFIKEMGLTKEEWIKLKDLYVLQIEDADLLEIDKHFAIF